MKRVNDSKHEGEVIITRNILWFSVNKESVDKLIAELDVVSVPRGVLPSSCISMGVTILIGDTVDSKVVENEG